MSIVTKRGDQGMTSLMYGRRISKCHPQVEAYGTIDELNSALGLARAASKDQGLRGWIESIQQKLVPIMGELATAPEDAERYAREGYSGLTDAHITETEKLIQDLEAKGVSFSGWATPGDTMAGAALDLARTVCRRAERLVCAFSEAGHPRNGKILVFLNRLSDLLWLMARKADATPSKD